MGTSQSSHVLNEDPCVLFQQQIQKSLNLTDIDKSELAQYHQHHHHHHHSHITPSKWFVENSMNGTTRRKCNKKFNKFLNKFPFISQAYPNNNRNSACNTDSLIKSRSSFNLNTSDTISSNKSISSNLAAANNRKKFYLTKSLILVNSIKKDSDSIIQNSESITNDSCNNLEQSSSKLEKTPITNTSVAKASGSNFSTSNSSYGSSSGCSSGSSSANLSSCRRSNGYLRQQINSFNASPENLTTLNCSTPINYSTKEITEKTSLTKKISPNKSKNKGFSGEASKDDFGKSKSNSFSSCVLNKLGSYLKSNGNNKSINNGSISHNDYGSLKGGRRNDFDKTKSMYVENIPNLDFSYSYDPRSKSNMNPDNSKDPASINNLNNKLKGTSLKVKSKTDSKSYHSSFVNDLSVRHFYENSNEKQTNDSLIKTCQQQESLNDESEINDLNGEHRDSGIISDLFHKGSMSNLKLKLNNATNTLRNSFSVFNLKPSATSTEELATSKKSLKPKENSSSKLSIIRSIKRNNMKKKSNTNYNNNNNNENLSQSTHLKFQQIEPVQKCMLARNDNFELSDHQFNNTNDTFTSNKLTNQNQEKLPCRSFKIPIEIVPSFNENEHQSTTCITQDCVNGLECTPHMSLASGRNGMGLLIPASPSTSSCIVKRRSSIIPDSCSYQLCERANAIQENGNRSDADDDSSIVSSDLTSASSSSMSSSIIKAPNQIHPKYLNTNKSNCSKKTNKSANSSNNYSLKRTTTFHSTHPANTTYHQIKIDKEQAQDISISQIITDSNRVNQSKESEKKCNKQQMVNNNNINSWYKEGVLSYEQQSNQRQNNHLVINDQQIIQNQQRLSQTNNISSVATACIHSGFSNATSNSNKCSPTNMHAQSVNVNETGQVKAIEIIKDPILVTKPSNSQSTFASYTTHKHQKIVVQASTSDLLRCFATFISQRCSHLIKENYFVCENNKSTYRSLKFDPSDSINWLRSADRTLMLQGWQEIAFMNPVNVVFVYLLVRDTLKPNEIKSVYDLQCNIMACLYLAFSYMGNEISYPLKPFLIEDNRDEFWHRIVSLINQLSTSMLRINQDPRYFTELFYELKSFSSLPSNQTDPLLDNKLKNLDRNSLASFHSNTNNSSFKNKNQQSNSNNNCNMNELANKKDSAYSSYCINQRSSRNLNSANTFSVLTSKNISYCFNKILQHQIASNNSSSNNNINNTMIQCTNNVLKNNQFKTNSTNTNSNNIECSQLALSQEFSKPNCCNYLHANNKNTLPHKLYSTNELSQPIAYCI